MKKKYRYSVLTYIFGDYDNVKEVLDPQDDVEYICVTDNKKMSSKTWKMVYDKTLDGLSIFEKCYTVRFNLFNYVSTDICIRLDGSLEVCKSLDPFIEKFNKGNYEIALMPHSRFNLLEEYIYRLSFR